MNVHLDLFESFLLIRRHLFVNTVAQIVNCVIGGDVPKIVSDKICILLPLSFECGLL